MRIRGLKQALHWLFLAVGLLSLVMLAVSVNTYMGYARDGYGLNVRIDDARINGDWLAVRLHVDNPGGLDIELHGGNVTLGGNDTVEIPVGMLPNGINQGSPITTFRAHNSTTLVLWVRIGEDRVTRILNAGSTSVSLNLEIYVPARYMSTGLTLAEPELEVRT